MKIHVGDRVRVTKCICPEFDGECGVVIKKRRGALAERREIAVELDNRLVGGPWYFYRWELEKIEETEPWYESAERFVDDPVRDQPNDDVWVDKRHKFQAG